MKVLDQLKRAACFILFLSIINSTNAQLCTPDPMYTTGGVHPDTSVALATGCIGSSYHQEFTIVVPADTVVFGFTFPINYMMVDSVGGLPPGILYLCNPGTCSYPGGSSGCFQLYGTPLASGVFNLTFYVHGQAIVFGSPTTLNFSYTGYEIYIGSYPVLTTGNSSATCNTSNGLAWVTASGSSGYSYSWNTTPVSNNDSIFNLAAGIYQVTVNSDYNCASIDTAIVNNLGAPQIDTIMVIEPLCYGGIDGSATVVATGGTLPYDYLWITGDTTATLPNVGMGTYSISISDANGCQVSSVATIGEPAQLLAFASHTDALCNGSNDGTAQATVIGGTGLYHYLWTSGDTTGCTATDSAMVSSPTPISISLVGTNESILGAMDGAIDATVSGGTPGYTYLWNNSATTQDITGLAGGTYILIVTDTNGCTHADTLAIQTIPGFGLTEENEVFKLYPNPARGYFYLEMMASGTMELYDVLGNSILSKNVNAGKQVVELPLLTKGIYMLAVTVGNQRKITKLMVD